LIESQANHRGYHSDLRRAQAQLTRRRILDAAYACFVRDGYPGTTMAGIARRAGVSPQTVYNAFTSKAALLKAVYDATLVGDDEPVPFAGRPEVLEVYARTDPRRFLQGYAELGPVLFGRLDALLQAILEGAAAGDTDLREHLRVINGERLIGCTMVATTLAERGWLRPDVTVEQARDQIWTLNSIEVHTLLVRERGWTSEAYTAWLAAVWADALL
jgi:AcrR family transcriptional regulator